METTENTEGHGNRSFAFRGLLCFPWFLQFERRRFAASKDRALPPVRVFRLGWWEICVRQFRLGITTGRVS